MWFYFMSFQDAGLESFISKYYYMSISWKPAIWYGVGHIERAVQRENTSIIIKVNAGSFEWCMICLSKMSLYKATRYQSEILDHYT